MRAVAVRGVVTGGSRLTFNTDRSELEDTVGKIHAAVAEWNESYPTLLAEYERDVEAQRAKHAAEQKRLGKDQELIDRLMAVAPDQERGHESAGG